MACAPSSARRESDRIHHTLYRLVGAELPAVDAAGDSAAPLERHVLAAAPAPHARSVCLLLCMSALQHLHLARSVLRLAWHLERHRQAAVHYSGLCRIRITDPACDHFNQCYGAPTRRQAL